MTNKDIRTTELKKKAIDTVDVLEHGFTTEKLIHTGYEEYENAKKKYGGKKLLKFKLKQYWGKWHYVFRKGDLKISLIQLNDRPFDKKEKWLWETHAYEDKRLFTDCRRFPTMEAAMKDIKSLLSE